MEVKTDRELTLEAEERRRRLLSETAAQATGSGIGTVTGAVSGATQTGLATGTVGSAMRQPLGIGTGAATSSTARVNLNPQPGAASTNNNIHNIVSEA